MAQEPQLTFKVFTSLQDDTGVPYFDSFPLFFANEASSEHYRTLHPYVELKREAPDLEARLREGISRLDALNQESLKPFCEDLYHAYSIMRKYVTSDTELGLPPTLTTFAKRI